MTRRKSETSAVLFRNLMALCLLAGGLAVSGCGQQDAGESQVPALEVPDETTLARVEGKLKGALTALRGGDYGQVISYLGIALDILPDGAMIHYYMAVAQANEGLIDDAMASMETAVELGFCDLFRIDEDPGLAALRDLDGWSALRERVEANQARSRAEITVSYRRLNPADEPDFANLAELSAHYEALLKEPAVLGLIYPHCVTQPRLWEALNHKVAGLEKFLAGEHENEALLSADVEMLRTAAAYENTNQVPWLDSTVELIHEKTAAFIERHFDNKEASAQAAYLNVRAQLCSRAHTEIGGGEAGLRAATDLLSSIHDRFPGTSGGLLSLMEALDKIAQEEGMHSEKLLPLVQKGKAAYAGHPAMQQLNYRFLPYVLATEGLPEFSGTDLDGKLWNTANLGEGVFLIDFWATWCGPCKTELPNLVALYNQYKDRGFRILGISLDQARNTTPEALREWMKEWKMAWPTIYDGKAWDAPGVRQCGISGIPFPILLDRDGKVFAAGPGATAENLRAALAKLFDEAS